MADPKRALVSSVSGAIFKKLAVKFEGNEILSVDDFDMFACYRDLWKTESEKWDNVRQSIIHSTGCTENCMKLQINTSDKNASKEQDAAIANAYGNKFVIPLDFEMLHIMIPYYQSGLGNRLCYEITLNDYDQVIVSPGLPAKPDDKHKIMDVSLEYEIVTQTNLSRDITIEYQSMALLYDRVVRDRQIPVNKLDMTWSGSFNTTCRSLKGILALFEAEQSYT